MKHRATPDFWYYYRQLPLTIFMFNLYHTSFANSEKQLEMLAEEVLTEFKEGKTHSHYEAIIV